MKKILVILIIFLQTSWNCFAQITLEHTYTTNMHRGVIKLSLSGIKYVGYHLGATGYDQILLYNINHSLYKTISIPQIAGFNVNEPGYVTETLFNLDSLTEFLIQYSGAGTYHTYVYNENGTVLLQVLNARWANPVYNSWSDGGDNVVFSIGNSSKLQLFASGGGWVKVYSLPGQLTCFECSGGIISGFAPEIEKPHKISSYPYPNPSAENITIKYSLPENCKKAWIEIFDIKGMFIKKFEIDNSYNEIILSNQNLSAGSYLYSVIADKKIIEQNKFMIIKN